MKKKKDSGKMENVDVVFLFFFMVVVVFIFVFAIYKTVEAIIFEIKN